MSIRRITRQADEHARDLGLQFGNQLVTVEPTRYALDDARLCYPAADSWMSPGAMLSTALESLVSTRVHLRRIAPKVREGENACLGVGSVSLLFFPVDTAEDGGILRSMAVFPFITEDEGPMIFACLAHLVLAALSGRSPDRLEFASTGIAITNERVELRTDAVDELGAEIFDPEKVDDFIEHSDFLMSEGPAPGMSTWLRRVASPVMEACNTIEQAPSDLEGAMVAARGISDPHWKLATERWLKRTSKRRS